MANILLPQQRINYTALVRQFTPEPNDPLPPRRKLVFQCELRSLDDGNAKFGIIGYPAWRFGANQKWTIGKTKIVGEDIQPAGPNETFPLFPNVAFGNIEIPLTRQSGELITKDKKDENKYEKFYEFLKEIEAKKIFLPDDFLIFKPRLFANPHSNYDVTIESNGFQAPTNPSPPADPSEG